MDAAKRVFILHGVEATPEDNWYPWLKAQLRTKGIKVEVPEMPDTNEPKIDSWIQYLKGQVERIDTNTYFVGHSLGCQAILRYFALLEANEEAGGVLLVAPFLILNKGAHTKGENEVLEVWGETPIDWKKARSHSEKFVAILSGNDRYIPLEETKRILVEKLGATTIVIPNGGHFLGAEGYKELHVALNEFLNMAR